MINIIFLSHILFHPYLYMVLYWLQIESENWIFQMYGFVSANAMGGDQCQN